MNIEEIRKELTKEEFINCLNYIGLDGDYCFCYKNKEFGCPTSINLNNELDNNGDCYNCKECWLNSIKNIEFKDEMDNSELAYGEAKTLSGKVLEKHNKSKKYTGSEILYMIEQNTFNDEDIIVDIDGEKNYIRDILNDGAEVQYLLNYAPFTIKQCAEVSFQEALDALYYNEKIIMVEYEGRKVTFKDNAEFSPTIYQIKEGKWKILN